MLTGKNVCTDIFILFSKNIIHSRKASGKNTVKQMLGIVNGMISIYFMETGYLFITNLHE